MSNVQVVRELYDAWDPNDADGWVARHFAPDAEWVDAPTLPDAGVNRGIPEIQAMANGLVSVAGQFEIHVQEYIEAGDEILVVFHMVGQGGLGGVPVDLVASHAVTVADGLVTRVRGFMSRDEGLAATGLS